MAADPSVLFFNADISAPSRAVNGAEPSAIVYTQQLSSPLVQRSSDHWLSVTRFSIVGADLPLFCPSIELGQINPRKTTYVVGLSCQPQGVLAPISASMAVVWEPQVQGQQDPPAPLEQQFLSRFYYSYDYDHMLRLINNAYSACWRALNTQYGQWWAASGNTAPFPGLSGGIPFVTYDGATDFFTVSARGSLTSEAWQIAMNEPLRQLLNHFSCTITPAADLPYVLRMPAAAADGYWRLTQQRSSSDAWSPVAAICLCTQMPIVSELNSAPTLLGRGDSAIQAPSKASVSVVTDVALPLARGDDYLGLISFGEVVRRRVQLQSTQPLSTINFSLWWKHRLSGELIPLALQPDGNASIKACLERRY